MDSTKSTGGGKRTWPCMGRRQATRRSERRDTGADYGRCRLRPRPVPGRAELVISRRIKLGQATQRYGRAGAAAMSIVLRLEGGGHGRPPPLGGPSARPSPVRPRRTPEPVCARDRSAFARGPRFGRADGTAMLAYTSGSTYPTRCTRDWCSDNSMMDFCGSERRRISGSADNRGWQGLITAKSCR